MSTSQAIYAGWMDIPRSAVIPEALERAQEDALAALAQQYASTLYRVAFSALRNSHDAEDAVQETFLRVLRHRDALSEVRNHRVWLIRIVWNIVLDRKRRAKTRPETDDVAELARVLPSNPRSSGPLPPSITRTFSAAWKSSPPRNARCSSFRPSKSCRVSKSLRFFESPNPACGRACSARGI